MNQKELFDQFSLECTMLSYYKAVIQNEFKNSLTEDEARQLICESSEHFETQVSKLRDLKLQTEEFIWSQIKCVRQ